MPNSGSYHTTSWRGWKQRDSTAPPAVDDRYLVSLNIKNQSLKFCWNLLADVSVFLSAEHWIASICFQPRYCYNIRVCMLLLILPLLYHTHDISVCALVYYPPTLHATPKREIVFLNRPFHLTWEAKIVPLFLFFMHLHPRAHVSGCFSAASQP